jgi:hypothetical protein|tara:strand:+ start:2905 stop:3207 length:303 start_codon:yes stop_codon:yes gene_type:complete
MAAINWSNITDLGQIPAAANTASDGSFWVGMLYMVWIILLMLTIGYGFEVAILVSSFAALVIGLLLVYAGLVAWEWIIVFVGVLLVMFFYIIWSRPRTRA